MKSQKTSYPDGRYTLQNKGGVYTEVEVKNGLVFIVGGLADGRTGVTIEHFESKGITVLPVVLVPLPLNSSVHPAANVDYDTSGKVA